MSEALVADRVAVTLAGAHALVDDLLTTDLTGSPDAELLESYRELERLGRRLAVVEHSFIAEVEARSLPFTHGAASTAVFLRRWLRLHPGEAGARVAAAHAGGRSAPPPASCWSRSTAPWPPRRPPGRSRPGTPR